MSTFDSNVECSDHPCSVCHDIDIAIASLELLKIASNNVQKIYKITSL